MPKKLSLKLLLPRSPSSSSTSLDLERGQGSIKRPRLKYTLQTPALLRPLTQNPSQAHHDGLGQLGNLFDRSVFLVTSTGDEETPTLSIHITTISGRLLLHGDRSIDSSNVTFSDVKQRLVMTLEYGRDLTTATLTLLDLPCARLTLLPSHLPHNSHFQMTSQNVGLNFNVERQELGGGLDKCTITSRGRILAKLLHLHSSIYILVNEEELECVGAVQKIGLIAMAVFVSHLRTKRKCWGFVIMTFVLVFVLGFAVVAWTLSELRDREGGVKFPIKMKE